MGKGQARQAARLKMEERMSDGKWHYEAADRLREARKIKFTEEQQKTLDRILDKHFEKPAKSFRIFSKEDFADMLRGVSDYSEAEIEEIVSELNEDGTYTREDGRQMAGGYLPEFEIILIFAGAEHSAIDTLLGRMHEELHHRIHTEPECRAVAETISPYVAKAFPKLTERVKKAYSTKPISEQIEELTVNGIEYGLYHGKLGDLTKLMEPSEIEGLRKLLKAIGYDNETNIEGTTLSILDEVEGRRLGAERVDEGQSTGGGSNQREESYEGEGFTKESNVGKGFAEAQAGYKKSGMRSLFDLDDERDNTNNSDVEPQKSGMYERLSKMSEADKAAELESIVGYHEELMLELEESDHTGNDIQQTLRGLDDLWQQLTAMYGEQPKDGEAAIALSSIESDVRRVRLGLLAEARKELAERGEADKEAYVTATGEAISYKSMAESDPMLQKQGGKLRAEDGEFCHAERVMRRLDKSTGAVGITGMPEIKSAQDVAYMTRFLETASNEHVFAVLVKDGQGTVVHIGQGNDSASTADLKALKVGCDRLQPDEVYIVHNHPSGNMSPSPQDNVLIKSASGVVGKDVKGIIMDTWRRTFVEFGEGKPKVSERDMSLDGTTEIAEYSMNGPDSMEFNNSHEDKVMQIMSADDAAKFIYKWRLGSNGKVGYLVQNRNGETTANISTDATDLTLGNVEAICEEAAKNAMVFSGSGIIFYGTMPEGLDHRVWQKMQEVIGKYRLRLNDAIQVDGRACMRRSYNDYGEIPSNVAEPDFRLGDPAETFDARREEAIANKGTVMPDLADKEVKVVDVPQHGYRGRDVLTQAIDAASKRYKDCILQYDNNGQRFEYTISPKGLKYAANHASHSANIGVHAAVMDVLDVVIGESVEVMEHADVHKIDGTRSEDNGYNADTLMHRFVGAVNIDGKIYRVITTLKEKSSGNASHHTYEVTKIEVPDANASSTLNATTTDEIPSVEVAKLLIGGEIHNKTGEKILEESKKASVGANPSSAETKRATVKRMSEALHMPVTIVEDAKETSLWKGADEVTKIELLGSTDGEGMPSTSYTSNSNGVGSVASSKDGHYPLAKLLKGVEKSYDKGKANRKFRKHITSHSRG